MSPLLLVMGVDEPNKLDRVAELVTIGGAFGDREMRIDFSLGHAA